MEIFFHSLKHHYSHMCKTLADLALRPEGESELFEKLKKFGVMGTTDIYWGRLSPDHIVEAGASLLKQENIHSDEELLCFLNRQGTPGRRGNYYLFSLPDGSLFVLRALPGCAHLHPARFSPWVFRLRVNTLKTVLFTVFYQLQGTPLPKAFSKARSVLSLSPLPCIPPAIQREIQRFWRHFHENQ